MSYDKAMTKVKHILYSELTNDIPYVALIFELRGLQCEYSVEQGKSEGFDSCDRPSNLKLDSNHRFLQPV